MDRPQTLSGYKTRRQLALEYHVSPPTLWRKLKSQKIDLPQGLICPKWQKVIYEQLGYPPGVSKKDFE